MVLCRSSDLSRKKNNTNRHRTLIRSLYTRCFSIAIDNYFHKTGTEQLITMTRSRMEYTVVSTLDTLPPVRKGYGGYPG